MSNKLRSQQGFTLIELLIVVAIIGILAAIAIPQFSAYRMRGYNSAANSDIRNAKTSEESMFADFKTYGKTGAAAGLLSTAGSAIGAGAVLRGPLVAASVVVPGGFLDGPRPDMSTNPPTAALPAGVGISLSNGVQLQGVSATMDTTAFISPSYHLVAKNIQGSRVFFTEAESTAVLFTQKDADANIVLGSTAAYATMPAVVDNTLNLAPGAATGNAAPYDKWEPM